MDPLACKISRVLTDRFEIPYLVNASAEFCKRLNGLKVLLASEPQLFADLGPGQTFEVGSDVFSVPREPAIGYWFDVSHMATLSVACGLAAQEKRHPRASMFEVAISSSIIRKWPNTISYAMDIDHLDHTTAWCYAQPVHRHLTCCNALSGELQVPWSISSGSYRTPRVLRKSWKAILRNVYP